MKKLAVVALLMIAAWVLGFWPERTRRKEAEVRHEQLARELAESQQRVRVAEVLGRLLALEDAIVARNYGIAQGLASPFFDAARNEANRAAGTSFHPVLEEILAMRDAVTVALSRADPAVEEMVRGMKNRLRNALGYMAAQGAAPAASPSPLLPAAPPAAETSPVVPTPSPSPAG